jgi:uncharacterized LabA/DUF88 family protein
MEETIVLIDEGFLSKLSKHFGEGKYLKMNYIKFAKNLSKKQGLFFKHLFYYTAPPFQQTPPTGDQSRRKEGYDKFIFSFSKNKEVSVREGRCQRLKKDGEFIYKQKGVDALAIIDLSHLKNDFPDINKIILVACDTDFCPAVEDIRKRGIEVILYTYFDRIRNSKFSRANELISCCSKHFQITKKDFEEAKL